MNVRIMQHPEDLDIFDEHQEQITAALDEKGKRLLQSLLIRTLHAIQKADALLCQDVTLPLLQRMTYELSLRNKNLGPEDPIDPVIKDLFWAATKFLQESRAMAQQCRENPEIVEYIKKMVGKDITASEQSPPSPTETSGRGVTPQ